MTDPTELVNLIDEFPEEKDRLMKILINTGGLSIPLIRGLPPEELEALEKLKSLGYIK